MNIRKRLAALSVVALAGGTGLVLAVNSAAAAGAGGRHVAFNGAPSASISHRLAPSCRFTNDSGTPVSSIAIDRLTGSDTVVWMSYTSNGVNSTTVTFKLVGPFGSNQVSQSQKFNVASSPATNIITPFGITFWAGNTTAGTWRLTVKSNTGATAHCSVFAS
jgi:hypothetical protein